MTHVDQCAASAVDRRRVRKALAPSISGPVRRAIRDGSRAGPSPSDETHPVAVTSRPSAGPSMQHPHRGPHRIDIGVSVPIPKQPFWRPWDPGAFREEPPPGSFVVSWREAPTRPRAGSARREWGGFAAVGGIQRCEVVVADPVGHCCIERKPDSAGVFRENSATGKCGTSAYFTRAI